MNIEALLVDLGVPRPLDPDARARLEQLLLEGDLAEPGAEVDALARVQVPRPLSTGSRRRLEALMLADARRTWAPRAAVALATAVAVLAAVLVVSRSPTPAPRSSNDRVAAGPQRGRAPAFADASPGQEPVVEGFENPSRSRARIGGPATASQTSGATPMVVAVVRGDGDQEAGFDGYMTQLNASGGINGRRVEVVDPSDPRAIATVNLSSVAVSAPGGPPAWARGPVLETLTASEDVLRGRVFSMASPPERQARLLASSVFPTDASSAVAAVYRGPSGIYADLVPRALREVLEARGVSVVELEYEPGRLVPLVPSDAVFLSLDKASTLAFLDYARGRGYGYSGTVACIFPMLDTDVAGRLEEGYLVLSPYSLGSRDEGRMLREASGRSLNSSTIHGWTTAKALSTVLARSGAETDAAAVAAFGQLNGYEHGFAPPYATRPGTNARTPEGVLYEVRNGEYAASGGFMADAT